MNTKQEENWMSIDEIKTKYDALHLEAISMLNKKKILNENVEKDVKQDNRFPIIKKIVNP